MIIKPVDMAPSKREGIRHAFTAESLRCIGSDEVARLRLEQSLEAVESLQDSKPRVVVVCTDVCRSVARGYIG
jgi:hypothetical protein